MVVIMVHEKHCWVHYFGPLAHVEGKLRGNNIVRYGLHKMQGEGLARHHEHLRQIFPDYVKSKKPLIANVVSRKRSSNVERGSTLNKKRLVIQQNYIGKNLTLRVQYINRDDVYEIKHDELVELVKRVIPATMQTKSWIIGEEYHWPTLSKKMRSALIEGGILIND